MEIIVRRLTGEDAVLEVTRDTTISEIKLTIRNNRGIPCHQQRLLFKGKVLSDSSTLADSSIYHQANLYLTLKISRKSIGDVSNTRKIFIQAEDGEVLTLDVQPHDMVDRVKNLVQEDIGVPYWRQVLRFNGKVLRDEGRSLFSYDVYNGAILGLMINRQDEREPEFSEEDSE
ncbi:uncharacterized protein L3040_005744 [Drepanopeziza brunnea f. sp. 'multigermtubi']|uniref:Polyubiquitin-B n=1 Tax=Marssonina brunnea f. sp. multigermtubi (strain MB_m1) TaxID=1072389 RepID=K1X0M5_MARBU|nr:polyubiquitin-B [Drepanopeziza brunnea f. sp. 'multigermtubi' MB_m1]EKD14423.1 polyubiquitin-B [Drepanopeziza brunnea f. sp. 'multigermtubi' MB_m1]KAJ5041193.1 hypothetical protein L3040_005744 [Drepanopeziza brunnea f. sp. 'multigermtubi']